MTRTCRCGHPITTHGGERGACMERGCPCKAWRIKAPATDREPEFHELSEMEKRAARARASMGSASLDAYDQERSG